MRILLENTQAYTLLKRESEKNRLSHAYLLLWEDKKYLKSALKTFAKLFFDVPEGERIGRLIDAETFADCLFFPETEKKLSVADAEKIKEESDLAPVEGEKKLFVLSDFAEANAQTQNKLLKLLEEPPKGVYFLLGASSSFPVLPTVLSRTNKLEIRDFSVAETTEFLARVHGEKYEKETYALCATASGGKIGDAESMLEGGTYQTLVNTAFSLALTPTPKFPALVKQIGESKRQKELLSMLRLVFRDALLMNMDDKKTANNIVLKKEKENLLLVAKRYGKSALLYAQTAISNAEKQVTFNAVFSQCIELCIADIRLHIRK